MMTSVIEIDTLKLDGFSEEDGRRAANAFEQTLAELLNRYGLPPGRESADISDVDLGTLPRTAASPDGLGRELARALFGRLWQ